MYKILWLLIAIVSLEAFSEVAEIQIVYPRKNQKVNASSKTFIIGNVKPSSDGVLTINGETIPVYKTGGFLAYVPVEQGKFEFVCEWKFNGETIKEVVPVYIPRYSKKSTTSKPEIEKQDYLPDKDIGITPGEEVFFQCKTLPNKKVTCKLSESKDSFLLYEQEENGIKGIYRTSKYFDQSMKEILFQFEIPDDPSVKPFSPPVTITVLPPNEYPILKIIKDQAKARFEPGGGYDTFLKEGTVLKSKGFEGEWYKVSLSKNHPVYIHKSEVQAVSPGELPGEGFQVGNIFVSENESETVVFLGLPGNVAGTWIEYPGENRIGIKFYKTKANIDRINIEGEHLSLQDIHWNQIEKDVLQMEFYLDFPPVYGHYLDFSDNKGKLVIRKGFKNKQRESLRICLDAGHGGMDAGAVGPTGVTEREVNLQTVKKLGKALKEKGFTVIYTREGESGPSLYERAPFAFEHKADLFISIHHNSTSDGVNPYSVRSTETFFYNRAGKILGQFLHPRVISMTGIKDAGLKFGNLAVCRNNAVPSILMEIDYLIIPEAEERIQSDSFQESVAKSIAEGIEDFVAASY